MKHARLICNQKEKFQCAECRKLTSNGFQLIGEDETNFVCKDCYITFRNTYPTKGKSIKHLLPAHLVFSEAYDPDALTEEEEPVAAVSESSGYIGELVPDGNGGWREPTAEEIAAMNEASSTPAVTPSVTPADDMSVINVKYRFTTDNKLQVILPANCRVDGRTYELIVTTEG